VSIGKEEKLGTAKDAGCAVATDPPPPEVAVEGAAENFGIEISGKLSNDGGGLDMAACPGVVLLEALLT
jgi:hypothetical protein